MSKDERAGGRLVADDSIDYSILKAKVILEQSREHVRRARRQVDLADRVLARLRYRLAQYTLVSNWNQHEHED